MATLRREAADRRVPRRLDDLRVVVQVLVQALAGAGSDDLDLDVLVGTVAGEADHLAGELDDLHRLAHVELEHLALVGHRTGLEHEAHGFGDGHEVARHLGIGDRDRSALDDLAEERRHDAAAAAEHVAEAHCREGQQVLVAHREDRELGDPLARAHDRARVDGLVGRDVHEPAAGGRRRPARASTCRARWSPRPPTGATRGSARACGRRRGTRRRARTARRPRAGGSRRGCRRGSARPCRATTRPRRAGCRRGRGAGVAPGGTARSDGRSRCRSNRRRR